MTRRRWMAAGAASLVVVAVVLAVRMSDAGLDVEIARVTRGPLQVTVDEEGRTRLRERFVVGAPVAGRLSRVTLVEGRRVSTGDVLATLAPLPEGPRATGVSREQLVATEARRGEATAHVASAQAAATQAERDLARIAKLTDAGAMSESALEQARLASSSARRLLEARRATLRAAEADVAAARAALMGVNPDASGGAVVEVRSPADGRVLRVLEKSSRVVAAGTPLVEIGDASGLEVVVDVLSEDAVRITAGSPVMIEQWGGDTALRGQVRLVEPEAFTKVSALGVEEQRVNVIVDLMEPPSSLGAGYRVEARIVTWQSDGALTVPTSALFQRQGRWTVFLVQDGRAVLRAVEIGHQSDEAAEVLDGLSEGDAVIVYPSADVSDGRKVH